MLRERSFGVYEGLGRDELIARRNALDLPNFEPTKDWDGVEGVEPDKGVSDRFFSVVEEHGLLELSRVSDVLVVSHEGVIEVAMNAFFGIRAPRRHIFKIRPGGSVGVDAAAGGYKLLHLWPNPGE